MIDVINKAKEYLRVLHLPNIKPELLSDIWDFIFQLNTDQIEPNIELICSLFCESTVKMNQELMTPDSKYACSLWNAFCNIQNVKIETEEAYPKIEILIIKFLNDINGLGNSSGREPKLIDTTLQKRFTELSGKLEEMKSIFRLELEGILIFPIGRLLSGIFENAFDFERLDSATFYTLLLALEIFNADDYPREQEIILSIIERCNLVCLKYFADIETQKIGGIKWKKNFEQNDVIILQDSSQRKIIIRHTKKRYFTGIRGDIQAEYNSHHREIAYFCELDYDENTSFCNAEDIICNGNIHQKLQLLDIIYNQKYFNIWFEGALKNNDGMITVTNPYSNSDKKIIFDMEERPARLENVSKKALQGYSLVSLWGKSLDYSIWGTLITLMDIYSVDVWKLEMEMDKVTENFQNSLINNWLDLVDDLYQRLSKLNAIFTEKAKYIANKGMFINAKIADIRFMPITLPTAKIEEAVSKFAGIESAEYEIETISVNMDFDGEYSYRIKAGLIDIEGIDVVDLLN